MAFFGRTNPVNTGPAMDKMEKCRAFMDGASMKTPMGAKQMPVVGSHVGYIKQFGFRGSEPAMAPAPMGHYGKMKQKIK